MRKFVAAVAGIGTALALASCGPAAEDSAEAPAEIAVEAPVEAAAPAPAEDLQAMDGAQDDGMASEAPTEEDERGNPVDQ